MSKFNEWIFESDIRTAIVIFGGLYGVCGFMLGAGIYCGWCFMSGECL